MNKTFVVGNLPSLNALRAFVLTAQFESVKQAASELNVTASAVTHQIYALESQIGMQLFTLDNNRKKLTTEGRTLYDNIHGAFSQIVYGLNDSLRQKEAVLRISAQASFAQHWITRHIAGFHEQHPNIRLELTTGVNPIDFDTNLADLAIVMSCEPIPNRMCWRISDEFLVPVCSPDFLANKPTPLTPEQMKDERLIGILRRPDDWTRWFTHQGVPIEQTPTPAFVFENSALGLDAALHGLGIVMGRSSIVCDYLREGLLVAPCGPLRTPLGEANYLVSSESCFGRSEIVAFRQWFKSAISASQQEVV